MRELQKQIQIYIAAKRQDDRGHLVDSMIMDGFNVTAFASADDFCALLPSATSPDRDDRTSLYYGLSGLEVVGHIRALQPWPYVYVVVMSSLNRVEEIEQGLEAGVDDYLLKPFSPVQLRARALVALRWLSYLDSLVQEQNTRQ